MLASDDSSATDWLAHVLGEAGFSVVVLPDVTPDSPELRGAELLIADSRAATALGDAGPVRRVFLSERGGTVNMVAIQGHFADVIALPASEEEVVARVQHAMRA